MSLRQQNSNRGPHNPTFKHRRWKCNWQVRQRAHKEAMAIGPHLNSITARQPSTASIRCMLQQGARQCESCTDQLSARGRWEVYCILYIESPTTLQRLKTHARPRNGSEVEPKLHVQEVVAGARLPGDPLGRPTALVKSADRRTGRCSCRHHVHESVQGAKLLILAQLHGHPRCDKRREDRAPWRRRQERARVAMRWVRDCRGRGIQAARAEVNEEHNRR
jgi:hypothetical protein